VMLRINDAKLAPNDAVPCASSYFSRIITKVLESLGLV